MLKDEPVNVNRQQINDDQFIYFEGVPFNKFTGLPKLMKKELIHEYFSMILTASVDQLFYNTYELLHYFVMFERSFMVLPKAGATNDIFLFVFVFAFKNEKNQ